MNFFYQLIYSPEGFQNNWGFTFVDSNQLRFRFWKETIILKLEKINKHQLLYIKLYCAIIPRAFRKSSQKQLVLLNNIIICIKMCNE